MYTSGDTDSFREDNTAVSDKVITADGDQRQFSTDTDITYIHKVSKNGSVDLMYRVNYEDSKNDIYAYNLLLEEQDLTESRYETINNLKQSIGVKYSYNSGPGGNMFFVNLHGNRTDMRDQDRYPQQESRHRKFDYLSANFHFNKRSSASGFSIRGGYTRTTPNLEMFADKLNVSDVFNLRGGNPDLKLAGRGTFGANYNTRKGERYWNADLTATLNDQQIVSRRNYFSEQTYLPEYDYTAPKGSTLITYANAGTSVDVSLNAGMESYIVPLRSKFGISMSYNYSNPQTGIEQSVVRMQIHNPSLKANLASNFSEKFKFLANGETGVKNYTVESGEWENMVYGLLSAQVRWDIGWLTSNAEYRLDISRNSASAAFNQDSHLLNLSVGCFLFKNRNGRLMFSAYDVLDRNERYTSQLYADHVYSRWSRAYSSYFLVSFQLGINTGKT